MLNGWMGNRNQTFAFTTWTIHGRQPAEPKYMWCFLWGGYGTSLTGFCISPLSLCLSFWTHSHVPKQFVNWTLWRVKRMWQLITFLWGRQQRRSADLLWAYFHLIIIFSILCCLKRILLMITCFHFSSFLFHRRRYHIVHTYSGIAIMHRVKGKLNLYGT